MSARIIIGADLVPTETNFELFESGDAEALIGQALLEKITNVDFAIFNLEAPLTDKKNPIKKYGPNLIAPTNTVHGYKAMGANILSLANNHILDQGEQGLHSTFEVLKRNGIAHVGAGNHLDEALKPYTFKCIGKTVGIYACTEHEFTIASECSSGANPFDPLETPDHVSALKKQCDFVIVLYHGGKEHYRYPSPRLRKICRKLVEKGADLVICQHSHCIGCEEIWNRGKDSGTIIYGQGNFLFDYSDSEFWKTSLLVQIEEDFTISYIPLIKNGNKVRMADQEISAKIMEQFKQRSKDIQQEGFVTDKYAEFSEHVLDEYLLSVSGYRHSIALRILNKVSGYRLTPWIVEEKYAENDLLALRNFIECEAHWELLVNGLRGRTV